MARCSEGLGMRMNLSILACVEDLRKVLVCVVREEVVRVHGDDACPGEMSTGRRLPGGARRSFRIYGKMPVVSERFDGPRSKVAKLSERDERTGGDGSERGPGARWAAGPVVCAGRGRACTTRRMSQRS